MVSCIKTEGRSHMAAPLAFFTTDIAKMGKHPHYMQSI